MNEIEKELQEIREKKRVIPATFDPVFKSLLTNENNRDYLEDLISYVTKIPKEIISKNMVVVNNQLPIEKYNNKQLNTDILVEIEKNVINLEMNAQKEIGIFEKNAAYYQKLMVDQYKRSADYRNIKRVIQINFNDFKYFSDEDIIIKFQMTSENGLYIDPIYVRKTENDFNEHIKIIEQYLEERIWNLSQFSEDYRPMEVNRIVQILPSCKELRAYLIQQYPGKRFIKENMDDVGNHLSNYKKALEAGDDVSDFKDIFLGDKQSLEQYAFHHLKNRQEISNQVFIMGTLCMEPEYYANEDSRLQTCQFPIASNRLRRIKEDGADKKTDYPWVKCFGPMAEQHSICLHTNSTIYINGAIEARDIEIEMCCEQCQQNFLAKSSSIEIVPYHIEYIDDCIIPESDRAYEEDGLMEGEAYETE